MIQNEKINQRRAFLNKFIGLSVASVISPVILTAGSYPPPALTKEGEGFVFLFQGDSITDGNRSRNNDWNHVMGHGYAYLIASRLGYDFPVKNFHFFNRGISGNKVADLADRWEADTIELKPDLLSILIGINDTSAFIGGDQNYTADQYESNYRSLLAETKLKLPNVKLVLCEPFILPVGKVKEKWNEYSAEVEKRRAIVRKISLEQNAILVEFQSAFNRALKLAPAEYWIWDGIHPMPAGHELMAREWINQVSKQMKFIKR
ncbi:SGNH/GDSL hydrolase family protein [Rubrolithibacter danxiaensis]|uniref:SGNH/GDSL hydrolase family protein n=1 Tax=Rubrolithibacter danxiaensis TaxID=3390805 RepID=UPI003BF8D447